MNKLFKNVIKESTQPPNSPNTPDSHYSDTMIISTILESKLNNIEYDTEDEEKDTKEDANKLVQESKYSDAIRIYSNLLKNNNDDYILLSNRSVAFIKSRKYQLALKDCVKTTQLKPDWAKGWGRLGASLYRLNKIEEAKTAYNKAMELEPNNIIYMNMLLVLNKNNLNMIPENFQENMLDIIMKETKLMDKMMDKKFQSKVLSMQSNPFEALQDDEIMGVIMNMMTNDNMMNMISNMKI